MATNYVKFKRGTPTAFNLLEHKEDDTLYFIYEEEASTGELYLGEKLIAGSSEINGATVLTDLKDVTISKVVADDLLVYDITKEIWVNKPISSILTAFVGATSESNGKQGLVPAPAQNETNLFLRSDGEWAEIVVASEAYIHQGVLGPDELHVDAIARILEEDNAVVHKGDIVILKEVLFEGIDQRFSYVYNGEAWVAMDSNYSAERVFFEEDLITTSAIGNITLTNGQATIPAKGKNLKQVFDAIFVEEKNPNATNPAVTVKLTEAGSYEVGTTTTINYKATLSAGSYSYGPATGITASSWSISDSNGHTAETSSGSFEDLLVEDNKIYSITATATHGEGAIPVTNTGNPCDSKKIAAGDKTGTSSTISGYRKTFYGTMTSKPEDIISDDIRALNSSSSALVNGSSFSINIPVGALRVLIAYPAHLRDLTSVLDKNDSNANIVSGFGSPATVKVEGASGYSAIDYKVYKMDFANPYSEANIFTVTI